MVASVETLLADFSSWTTTQWVAVALALAIGAINVGLGVTSTDAVFLIIGVTFFVGVAIFCTRYWRSVLYLVAATHIAALGVVWILSGLQNLLLGAFTGFLSVSLFVIVLYRFGLDMRS